MSDNAGHMSPEEFRRQGYATIDWIADYWASLDDLPVLSQVAPGDVRRALPASPPEQAEGFDALLADLDEVVVPGLTHWQHPRYFAYFPANSSPAAILGDLLSSGIGAQGMIWATSPAVTEVEQVVVDWLAQALGLPEQFQHRARGPVAASSRTPPRRPPSPPCSPRSSPRVPGPSARRASATRAGPCTAPRRPTRPW